LTRRQKLLVEAGCIHFDKDSRISHLAAAGVAVWELLSLGQPE
jgi:hypothetical protein